jgi:small subunit ribosomal protein S3
MEERKFVAIRKEEFGVKEFIKKEFGKGKLSAVKIEYTPVGEKVIISTHKPGLIIGKRGESIEKLTEVLKKRFKMENPRVDIAEIKHPDLDAQIIADDIALSLERFGSLRFKAIAYKALVKIKSAGALGAEIVLAGRLPSERAKMWRFKFGYLRKTGDAANDVNYAESQGVDKQGMVGIKVSILSPETFKNEEVVINDELLKKLRLNASSDEKDSKKKKAKK